MVRKKAREKTAKQVAKARELMVKKAIRGVKQDVNVTFDAAIRTIRKAIGLTQQELSSKLSLSKAMIAQWELGLALPRQAFLPVIEGVFGMKSKALFKAFENSMVNRALSKAIPA